MKIVKALFVGIIVLVIIGGIGVFISLQHYQSVVNYRSESSELVAVSIPVGSGAAEIAEILYQKNLIADTNVFQIYLRLEELGGQLKAGEYEFRRNQSIPEIVNELINGAVEKGIQVTYPEGFSSGAIAARTAEVLTSNFNQAEFERIVANPDTIDFSPDTEAFLSEYKPISASLEGYLYPDTYEFAPESNELIVLEKILQNTSARFAELEWQGSTEEFFEKLTLASIVEKESFTNEEKPLIASVFANRLEIGMLLQSDATVNFVSDADNPRPTFAELAIDSPYNTYKYAGLPPGPITNPRRESIKAAINPAESDYYFFIHEQDGSGQVHFGRNEQEHFENVRKYLD